MSNKSTIVFVCEHGAAKSIIAAAYFNKFSQDSGSALRAIARGTNPDAELSAKTVAGLKADGLSPTESLPQKLTPADLEGAQHIVTFCELPDEYRNKVSVEIWDDVPPISENYELARDEIVKRIQLLLNS